MTRRWKKENRWEREKSCSEAMFDFDNTEISRMTSSKCKTRIFSCISRISLVLLSLLSLPQPTNPMGGVCSVCCGEGEESHHVDGGGGGGGKRDLSTPAPSAQSQV